MPYFRWDLIRSKCVPSTYGGQRLGWKHGENGHGFGKRIKRHFPREGAFFFPMLGTLCFVPKTVCLWGLIILKRMHTSVHAYMHRKRMWNWVSQCGHDVFVSFYIVPFCRLDCFEATSPQDALVWDWRAKSAAAVATGTMGCTSRPWLETTSAFVSSFQGWFLFCSLPSEVWLEGAHSGVG